MASKRVESRKAVIQHFVRGEEAHTRRAGFAGNHGLASVYVETVNQVQLQSNGVVVAILSPLDSSVGNVFGTQVLVYPDTSVIGELVPELKSRGFRKALRSPAVDVWLTESKDE